MGLNPISFAVIIYIFTASIFYISKRPKPFAEAVDATMGGWFLISCYHYFKPILQ